MEWQHGYLDALLVPLGLVVLLAYHAFFYWMTQKHPLRTVVGINHVGRTAWVHGIMKDNDKRNILAVQTLRNTIMASTLMASTAIFLSSGIAAFLSSTYSVKKPLLQNWTLGLQSQAAAVSLKFIALLSCLLFSFICYMQSIRFANHVGFLINIPSTSSIYEKITPDYVAGVLARGSNFYTVGTRVYYLAFSLLLWMFGPVPVAVTCIVVVPLLYYLDIVKDDIVGKDEDPIAVVV